MLLTDVEHNPKEIKKLFFKEEVLNLFVQFKNMFEQIYPIILEINESKNFNLNDYAYISLKPFAAINGKKCLPLEVDEIKNRIDVMIKNDNLNIAVEWINEMLIYEAKNNNDEKRKEKLVELATVYLENNKKIVEKLFDKKKDLKFNKKDVLLKYYIDEDKKRNLKKENKILIEQLKSEKNKAIDRNEEEKEEIERLRLLLNLNRETLEKIETENKELTRKLELSQLNLKTNQDELEIQKQTNRRLVIGSRNVEDQLKSEKESILLKLDKSENEVNLLKKELDGLEKNKQNVSSDLEIYRKEAENLRNNLTIKIAEVNDSFVKQLCNKFKMPLYYLYFTCSNTTGDQKDNILAIIEEIESSLISFGLEPYEYNENKVLFNNNLHEDMNEEAVELDEVYVVTKGWKFKNQIIEKAIVRKG